MEIKSSPSIPDRNVQASRQSDSRQAKREADFSNREVAEQGRDRNSVAAAGQASEARFFAIEGREETQPDPRQQVRATRERVRQTYSDQENREARRADREQQAQDVQAEESAQRHQARQPIDLIA